MITPTMKFSEIKGFQTMVEAGLRGESEYSLEMFRNWVIFYCHDCIIFMNDQINCIIYYYTLYVI